MEDQTKTSAAPVVGEIALVVVVVLVLVAVVIVLH